MDDTTAEGRNRSIRTCETLEIENGQLKTSQEVLLSEAAADVLWAHHRPSPEDSADMRFAFYGRVSTEDQQDPQSSKAWQLSRARSLIEPAGGEIVAEFFDIGQSRSLPWKRRPEALRLLDTIKSPARDFDAVVIGEPQRAFYGSQFGMTFPVFVHYGVGLWVPEIGGAIDPGSDAHDLVMALYGGMSKGERNRIKVRVRSAMKAQTELEGRFLGGRPPYGYRLADGGPHPNPSKAAEGKRLHRLEPDPVTARVVARIFNEYVAGQGMTSIARGLTQDGIAFPSAYDRARNPHRHTQVWETTAIRAILQNPRYTGRQVWNRARTDEVLIDVDDVALGHENRHRWNDPSQWTWSRGGPTHRWSARISTNAPSEPSRRVAPSARAARLRDGAGTPTSFAAYCGTACAIALWRAASTTDASTTGARHPTTTSASTASRTRPSSTSAKSRSRTRLTGSSARSWEATT
ncbi:recombinase family protein [Actinoplanes sp. LDG1-06]|uniref:Recombinase family protein n=1 Tax=Paractinoplanes ovalisporus TaxID=2810368 RepID=A0ABS2AKY8_9ACTN|nr:recombinase family protein [Actinoplanes ovalisporus]MBM2620482.1 recombinase family protein [Actinoplanes ovalisporus]